MSERIRLTFLSILCDKGTQGMEMCTRIDKMDREKKNTASLSNGERVNDGRSGTAAGGGVGGIKASHSHLKILTHGLSWRPITHPHQHIPNPERIHRCR